MNESQNTNAGLGLGIAGFALGILSVPVALIGDTYLGGAFFGVLGIALSIVGLNHSKKANSKNGIIVAALVISIIGLAFSSVKLKNGKGDIQIKIDISHDDEIDDEKQDNQTAKELEKKLIELECNDTASSPD